MENKVQLITYVSRLVEGGLSEFYDVISEDFAGVFGGVHLLPFFYPIDGTDAGFDPIDHASVDPRLGNWNDIERIARKLDVVSDLIVNHISSQSLQFQDFLTHGDKSQFKDLFLTRETVFVNGTSAPDIEKIYRPRPGPPFTEMRLQNGLKKSMWTTFTPGQVDINVEHPIGQSYLDEVMTQMSRVGVRLLRLDAVGYAVKRQGSDCFMLPQTYQLISKLSDRALDLGMEVLVEIHSHYSDQIEIARHTDFVYDFALPPLVLHAIYTGTSKFLCDWYQISPRNCVTVLDTHDGIGIIDVGRCRRDPLKFGLLPDDELSALLNEMHKRTEGVSINATGEAAKNLDLYQVNSTYYDVLGRDDQLYLLARAIQFFSPGIPQVYYMGFLAEPNDEDLFARTGIGRDMNRHFFTRSEVQQALKRPVVQRLIKLIKFRNTHHSFNGSFYFEADTTSSILTLSWSFEDHLSKLMVDFSKGAFTISYGQGTELRSLDNELEI